MNFDLKSFGIGLIVGAIAMLVVCAVSLLVAAWVINKHKLARLDPASAYCPTVGDEAVRQLLKPIRQKYNVPAMAAAVVTSDGIRYVGAVGVRKRGTEVPIGLDDLWHLGSDGKAMASTLIAHLVEQGKLRWDSTLGEIFPDLAPEMNPEFRQVNLLQLLSHQAGLPPNAKWNRYRGGDATAERLRVVRQELNQAPQSQPGTKYEYSNLGYVIAGAVVEKVTGKPWEEAISTKFSSRCR